MTEAVEGLMVQLKAVCEAYVQARQEGNSGAAYDCLVERTRLVFALRQEGVPWASIEAVHELIARARR